MRNGLRSFFDWCIGTRTISRLDERAHHQGQLAVGMSLLAIATNIATLMFGYGTIPASVYWVSVVTLGLFSLVIPLYRWGTPIWSPASEIANNLIPATLCLSCGHSAMVLGGDLSLTAVYSSSIPLLSVMICRHPFTVGWPALMVCMLTASLFVEPAHPFRTPGWLTLTAGITVVTPTLLCMLLHRAMWENAWQSVSRVNKQLRVQHQHQRALDKRLATFEREESLGLMAGRVAHDLNNFLTAVLSSAELAKLSIRDEQTEELLESLSTIEHAAKRAGELSQQLLNYTGKRHQTMAPIHLTERMSTAITLSQAACPPKTKVSVYTEPDIWVEGDATQLDQAIVNLVRNAAQAYEPETGLVEVWLDRFDMMADGAIGELDPNLASPPTEIEYARLRVSDHGKGISKENLDRIFEPFYTDRSAGKGLGLAAVSGIVAAHGGTIFVNSSEGDGAEFTVLLPLVEPKSDGATHDGLMEPERRRRASGRVLVADDEPSVRQIVARLVERMGFEPVLAENGLRASEIFEADRTVLGAILDVSMPEMDGHEVLARIRSKSRIPVLLMSGYASTSPVESRDDEFTEFLTKPFSLADLQARLEMMGLGCKPSQPLPAKTKTPS